MVSRFLRLLRGPVMPPEEVSERVEMLEAKVRANRVLIDQHAANPEAHNGPPQVPLDG